MNKSDKDYMTYLEILKEELMPAMGCTEPIAVAYCAAKAKETLGMIPDKVNVEVSGNIIKNVKSVVVPNTGGLKGIKAAVAAGIVGGKADKELEVIAEVTDEQKVEIKNYLETADFKVSPTYGTELLDIIISLEKDGNTAKVRICKAHTNVVLIEKNGEVIFEKDIAAAAAAVAADKKRLNVKGIIEFADMVEIDEIKEVLDRQISYNSAISAEGFVNDWGANIGRLLQSQDDSLYTKMKAAAAAGSDARMSGCELPVVIVSGSGNQGITASMPIVVYAKEKGLDQEKLYRGLCVADLIAVHIKTGIGPLSAFCGAVCAGIGAGAAIAYLETGKYEAVAHTIINACGILSGMICDGAKPSCAAKIAASVDAGLTSFEMYKADQNFLAGDGILGADVETTIVNIGRLGRLGMAETDHEILRIMTE